MNRLSVLKSPIVSFVEHVSFLFVYPSLFLPQMGSDFHMVIYLDLVNFSLMKPSDLSKIPTLVLVYNILPQEEKWLFPQGDDCRR